MIQPEYTVIIDGRKRGVYLLNQTHEIEGEESDKWVSLMNMPFGEDEIEEGIKAGLLVPYHSFIERFCWDIKIYQKNFTKEKWDKTIFRSQTVCEMRCNGTLVYSFTTTGSSDGMSFAFAKAQYLQTILVEHPFNFLEPEKEQGREILFYGLPAQVEIRQGYEKWKINICPLYTEHTKEKWWKLLIERSSASDEEREDWEEYKESDYINWGDALSDQHIKW
jgi:hypothetical protein